MSLVDRCKKIDILRVKMAQCFQSSEEDSTFQHQVLNVLIHAWLIINFNTSKLLLLMLFLISWLWSLLTIMTAFSSLFSGYIIFIYDHARTRTHCFLAYRRRSAALAGRRMCIHRTTCTRPRSQVGHGVWERDYTRPRVSHHLARGPGQNT